MISEDEVRVILDTGVFVKAIMGIEPEAQVYNTAIRICHVVVVSGKIIGQYMKTLWEKYGYRGEIIFLRIGELQMMRKIRNADRKIRQGVHVQVDVPEKDKHIAEAAVALGCQYIISEDERHILSKRDNFDEKHRIKPLSPEEYIMRFAT